LILRFYIFYFFVLLKLSENKSEEPRKETEVTANIREPKEIGIFGVSETIESTNLLLIFNIDEAKNDSMESRTRLEYRTFNSPTPQAENSKLDVTFDEEEVRTQAPEFSMINIK